MYRSNPESMLSMNYGELPTKRHFMRQYERELGDEDYQMLLRGEDDTFAADRTVFADAIEHEAYFDAEDMWKGIKQLKRQFDAGNKEAGDLASAILYTLGIEWI